MIGQVLQTGDDIAFANVERLLAISQVDDHRRFWEAMVAFLQDIAPHSVAVVSLNFSAIVFHDGTVLENSSTGRILRIEQIYHDLQSDNVPGTVYACGITRSFPSGVSSIGLDTLRKTQAYYHPLIQEYGCNHLTVLSTVFPQKSSDFYHAINFAIYHHFETAETSMANMKRYRKYLDSIVRSFYSRAKLNVQTGLNDFVAGLPIGVLLIDPFDEPISAANAEAYRQAYLWNVAPHKKVPSDYKSRFEMPVLIKNAIEHLGWGWRDWVIGRQEKFETEIHLTHQTSPELHATVKMAINRMDPFATPEFLVRLSVIHPADQPNAVEIGDLKISALAELTNAERKVALHVVKGFSNNEIARLLGRQPSTIKEHLTHIYEKLKVRNRTQLIGRLIERTHELGVEKGVGSFGFVTAAWGTN